MAQAICPNVDWTVGPHGRDGYQQFPNQSQQGTADHSQKADLGTTPKVRMQHDTSQTARAAPHMDTKLEHY